MARGPFLSSMNLDAPVEGGAGNRQVLQAGFDEGDDLVAPLRRADEFRVFLVELQQLVLVFGELEEVAFLLHPFHRCALRPVTHAVGAHFRFVLAVIGLVAHGIPAGIAVLVDVTATGHQVPDIARGLVVTLFRGADEIVVRGVEHLAHRAELVGVALGELFRRNTFRPRRLLHLLAMFVGAGQEENIHSVQALKACHGVRRNQLIGMADMRLAVGIGDRGGDVERCLVCHDGLSTLQAVFWIDRS